MMADNRDREVVRGALNYLEERMEDGGVLRWAAQLRPEQAAEREAVRRALAFRGAPIAEPYRSAWQCVLEVWRHPPADASMKTLEIAEAVLHGLDPLALLEDIVDVVAPRLTLEDDWALRPAALRRRRRTVSDVLSLRLGAPGEIVGLATLGIDPKRHVAALPELADRLEAELIRGLHRAARMSPGSVWAANWIARVYAPPPPNERDAGLEEGDPEERDPDAYRHGFVPLVRLITEVLAGLAAQDAGAARARVERLRQVDFPLARRIWAALARDPALVAGAAVGAWFADLPDREFWRNWDHPEVAELRARRVLDLPPPHRDRIETRIRRGPPARIYARRLMPDRLETLRQEATASELRRLVAGGAQLASASEAWFAARGLTAAAHAEDILEGLYETDRPAAFRKPSVSAYPEQGGALLRRLETELATSLYDGSARPAMDFVTVNAGQVFDILTAEARPDAFPRVWASLAAAAGEHLTGGPGSPDAWKFGTERGGDLLTALAQLPAGALDTALDGLLIWMERAARGFRGDPRFERLWQALWPPAVAETNGADAGAQVTGAAEDEQLILAANNSPVGRLMRIFWGLAPSLDETPSPFDASGLQALRTMAMSATGLARRHALYQLLVQLPYLRRADPGWADRALIPGLVAATGAEVGLWDAISRIAVLPVETMSVIGPAMAAAAAGRSLPDKVRARLAERLTLAMLRAYLEAGPPPCPPAALQQMLRRGGEAIRIGSARALRNFAARPGASSGDYVRAIRPFLQAVWPFDRAAMSPALSEALASLPARAGGDAFVGAVADIAGLLVPFNAWSIWAYGLFERAAAERTLLYPDTADQAHALLVLFDLTIADAEGAVTPRDLDVALERMADLAPDVTRDKRYLRLSSLARRE